MTKSRRRLTCDLPERPCEVGLAGKIQCQRNIDQRSIALYQQGFCTLKALGADVAMWRLPHCVLEGARKMVSAQACNRCHAIKGKIALQVRFYVIQNAEEPALIEASPGATKDRLVEWRAQVFLQQPCRQAAGQGVNQ
jgi:hypothetical protein